MEKVLELIRQSAGAFLYIFINSDADLNRTIMEKRERQITLLRRIATDADITYWKAERAVRDGIFAVFGKEPDEILAHLYSNTGKTVMGMDYNALRTYLLNYKY